MISSIIDAVFHFFVSLGLPGAFLSMVLENLGIPLPTEIGYLIGQDQINSGRHSYWFILAILTLGHLTGSLLSYALGRFGDKKIVTKLTDRSRIKQAHTSLRSWYKKYGNYAVFFARFVGYVRPWSSLVAGLARVEFWPFFSLTLLGSLIFNAIALYASGIIILIWRQYTGFHTAIILTGVFLFFGLIIWGAVKKIWQKRRDK